MALTDQEAPAADGSRRRSDAERQPDPDRPAPGRPGPRDRRLRRVGLGLPAALHRHPHRHRDAARVRPLRDGQAGRHEGDRVLRRLRASVVVSAPRGDRVRREGDPGRRVRAHHGFHVHRGRGAGGRAARLPPATVPPTDHRGLGGLGHASPHRLRARTDPGRQLREAHEQLHDRLGRALVRPPDPRRAGRLEAGRHRRLNRWQDVQRSERHDQRRQAFRWQAAHARSGARRQADPPDGHTGRWEGNHGRR